MVYTYLHGKIYEKTFAISRFKVPISRDIQIHNCMMEFEISGISRLAQKKIILTTEQCFWSCDFTQTTIHTLEPVESCEVIACSILQQGIWDKTYSCGDAQMVCFRYVPRCCHGCSITETLLSPFRGVLR